MNTQDDFSECIQAYKNLIITYNTSLLKKLPRDVVDACTEYTKKTANLPEDGKTRKVLAKLIENQADDKRPIASYIGGPMNISCHWSEKYKKLIYIIGERHTSGDDCSRIKKGRRENPEIINIVDYLKQYFSFPTAFTDFYLETPAFIMPEGYYYQFTIHNRINMLRHTFHKCIDPKLRGGEEDCNLSRMHYFDIRQGDVKDGKLNIISIFIRDGIFFIEVLKKKSLDKIILFEHLKAFYRKYYNIIRLFMFLSHTDLAKDSSQHYYNMWYSQIKKFPLLQKELGRVVGYGGEDMKDLIVDFIKEELTVMLGRTIVKEGLSQKILKKASTEFNTLCNQYFQDFKEYKISEQTKIKYSKYLSENLEKIVHNCIAYNSFITDAYLLARVFKKFDIDTEDQLKKRSTDEPEEPHNIIIYGGTSHCKIYRKFLTQLGFEDKGSSGQMNYENLLPGDVEKCINMSSIKQPLFSDWPPIKPKSSSPFIQYNSFVDKDELFKVPETVTKLPFSGPRTNQYSYKKTLPSKI